jgi:ATP-dependent exoDNAse (exonuclease V) beta subunit
LARVLARAVRAAAEDRRREGRLQFHDLLVHARRLLQDPEHGTAVRRAVRDRYRRLLIDEFQDTDPIQMELARLIGADPDRPVESGAAAIDPGRLFFVGDPKQSIYRFRRADIGVYLDAQRSVGAAGTVALVTNFRSTEPVLRWVNHVFAELIKPVEGRQPEFRPLVGQRRAQPVGPGVAVLGHEPIEAARAEDLRRAEAQQLVAAVATILAEGWTVDEPPRPATLGDICILLPTRTSLPTIERELLAAGIAYRAETANLVFASQEIRDLLLVARAIDDPTDALALVSALRSPAFGCGDDDLYTFRQGGGRFDHQSAVPAGLAADHPVAESLGWLAAAHTEAAWLSPSALLERIVRERRLLELAVVDGRQREVWRRLRFVVDQARAWSDTTGGSLRQFLRWAHLQGSESSRVAETVLPETDADAVRILTVHGAKGLEFPITILAGLTTEVGGSRRGVQVLWGGPDRAPAIAIRAGVRTADFATMAPLDEEMDDYELRRLLYVACTRACDHLVVSLCRRTSATAGAGRRTYAGLLAACGGLDDVAALDPRGGVVPAPAPTHARPDPVAPLPAWQAARQAALERAGHSGTVSATTVARLAQPATADPRQHPGLAKEPRDLDLAPWQKGRYGTAIGRAVHGVLQSIDLTTGAELQPLAAAQAAAEGVFGHEAQIERMVASALADPLVREAAASAHWRELFVAAPVGERLLEGYLDLLFRRADGLVIVDYKTDSYADETDLDAKLARYRLQMAAYAVAVEAATGQRVVGASLLFLAGARAVAVPVEDLPAAMAEAVAALPTISYGGEAVLE